MRDALSPVPRSIIHRLTTPSQVLPHTLESLTAAMRRGEVLFIQRMRASGPSDGARGRMRSINHLAVRSTHGVWLTHRVPPIKPCSGRWRLRHPSREQVSISRRWPTGTTVYPGGCTSSRAILLRGKRHRFRLDLMFRGSRPHRRNRVRGGPAQLHRVAQSSAR